jgi:hypothetical protein
MSCGHLNDYDSIGAHDKRSYNYNAKVLIPTKSNRLDIVAEHQGTQGDAADIHDASIDSKWDSQIHLSTKTEIRPEITTQNSFKISANSLGLKWNFVKARHFGMSFYFSAMHLNTDIDIAIPAYLTNAPSEQHIALSDNIFSPKFEVYAPLTKRLMFSGSISYAGVLDDDWLSMLQISVNYLLTENFSLGLGAKQWNYSLGDDGAADASLTKDKLNFSAKSKISLISNGILGELNYRF